MKIAIFILYMLVGTLTVLIVGDWQGTNSQLYASRVEYVQVICDMAHNQVGGASELACGQAQEDTNSEYMCNNLKTSCWVEMK